MFPLRKRFSLPAARKTSRFSRRSLRPLAANNHFYNLNRIRYASNEKYSPRAADRSGLNSYRLPRLWMFHDASTRVDPLAGFSFKDRDYLPLLSEIAEGQADNRFFSGSFNAPLFPDPVISTPSPARVPAAIRRTKYLMASSSAPLIEPSSNGAFLQFAIPRQVLICVRRKQRHEIMHAIKRAGTKVKKGKWTEDSYIRC